MRDYISQIEQTYAEMSPEKFAALKRDELTEEARVCYDRELARRKERTMQNLKTQQKIRAEHDTFTNRFVQSGNIVLVRPPFTKRQYYTAFAWKVLGVLLMISFIFPFLPHAQLNFLSIMLSLILSCILAHYWNRKSLAKKSGIRCKEKIIVDKEGVAIHEANLKDNINSSAILGINIYEQDSDQHKIDIYYSPASQSSLYSLFSIPYANWLIENHEIATRANSLGTTLAEYLIAILNNRVSQRLPVAKLPEFNRDYQQDLSAFDKVSWHGRELVIKRIHGSILNRSYEEIKIPIYAIKGTHLYTRSINYSPTSRKLTIALDHRIANRSSIELNIGGGGEAYQIYEDCVFASSLIYRK